MPRLEYQEEMVTAYCWQSGGVQVTSAKQRSVPEGAIALIAGPKRKVHAWLNRMCRLPHRSKPCPYLIPGLPERELLTPNTPAEDILRNWFDRAIRRTNPKPRKRGVVYVLR